MSKPKGTCPVCNKVRGLKKDGTIRAHGYSVAAWHGRVGTYCTGENRRPKEYYMEAAENPRPPKGGFNAPPADAVHNPPHYKQVPGIECIEVTQHFNFNRGNAIKYLWRAGAKGDEVEDLKKAREYIDFEIARLENRK